MDSHASSYREFETGNEVTLWARKPVSLKDCKDQVTRTITRREASGLTADELVMTKTFRSWGHLQKARLIRNRYWKIFLEKENIELVVDTEGYDYPRYIGILERHSQSV